MGFEEKEHTRNGVGNYFELIAAPATLASFELESRLMHHYNDSTASNTEGN